MEAVKAKVQTKNLKTQGHLAVFELWPQAFQWP